MPERHEGQPDGVGAVAHADGVLRAEIGREFPLERLSMGPMTYWPLSSTSCDVRVDLTLDVVILPHVTIERDLHCLSP